MVLPPAALPHSFVAPGAEISLAGALPRMERLKRLVEQPVGLLQHLYRLAKSMVLAERIPNPTECVHGIVPHFVTA